MADKLIEKLPFKDLTVDVEWNARTLDLESSGSDDQSFADLVESIKAKGQEQPVLVRPVGRAGKFALVAGFRRYHAIAKIAEERGEKNPTIRALVRTMSDIEAIEANALENASEKLRPADQCFAIGRLQDAVKAEGSEWTQQSLAARVGMSQGFASKMLGIWNGLQRKLFHEWRKMAAPLPYNTVMAIAALEKAEQPEAWKNHTATAAPKTEAEKAAAKKKAKLDKLCKEAQAVGTTLGKLERAGCIDISDGKGVAMALWGDIEGLTPREHNAIAAACAAGYSQATRVQAVTKAGETIPADDDDDDDETEA